MVMLRRTERESKKLNLVGYLSETTYPNGT